MTRMTVLPRGHDWTVADLEGLPDDGLRYELVDGTLLVSAAPSKLHQRALGNLHLLLRPACPAHLEVFLAPTDYQPTVAPSRSPCRSRSPSPSSPRTCCADGATYAGPCA